MPKFKVRPGADTYGHAVGILLLDYRGPFIPGDVGNATTYGYPVLYRVVKGLTLDRVLVGDPAYEEAVVEACKEMEAYGVRAISSDCGFLINYQEAVTRAVKIPVLLSSMLQLPFIASAFGNKRPVGLVTATSEKISNRVLEAAGVRTETPIIIKGMQEKPHFDEAIMRECGELDPDVIEAEVIQACREVLEQEPDTAAFLLECSLLPPYARAVQEAVGRPVFDFISMINYLYAGTHPKRYEGYY